MQDSVRQMQAFLVPEEREVFQYNMLSVCFVLVEIINELLTSL